MIGSGSRGTDSTSVGNGMGHGISKQRSSPLAVRGSEAKAIKTLLSALDSRSFDTGMFAALLSMSPTAMQMRFLNMMYVYFSHLAQRFEDQAWLDDEEMELYKNGALARDSLIHFM